nr:hypothetical protein [Tanacetum cinerariifolium]
MMSDMKACLNDLSYIPLNNEQNEPTQGDISETSNEPTQAIHNKFKELYASANEKLYPGCDYVTRLDCMAKFTYFKVKESYFMLTLLIVGPKSSGKDIDVYLRSLIDDLKDLWAKPGVKTIDIATGQKFNMRVMVLWTINDFLVQSSLYGWIEQGYKAFPTCNEDTPSTCVLGKTAYVGQKRFLKKHINGRGHLISMVKSKTKILLENLTRMTSWLNLLDCPRV